MVETTTVKQFVCGVCKREYLNPKLAEECEARGVMKLGTRRKTRTGRKWVELPGEWGIGTFVALNDRYFGIVIEEFQKGHYIIPAIKAYWNDHGLYEKGKVLRFDDDYVHLDSIRDMEVCTETAEALIELGEIMKKNLSTFKSYEEEE